MKYFLLPLLGLVSFNLGAQLHDNMWMVSNHSEFLMFLDFRENPPNIISKNIATGLFRPSTYCNPNGELQYYSNSKHIFGKDDNIIENGDSINVGYYFTEGVIKVWHGIFFLPDPGDSSRCYLIYMFPEKYPGVYPIPIQVRYALIDNAANNGMGKVLEKEIPILNGGLELNFDHACATRHANGRDWWILVPNRMEPEYYRILLTPNGFSQPELQEIGLIPPTNDPNHYLSFGTFSPNGEKYAEFEARTGIVQYFDFDRCTGQLFNPDTFKINGTLIDPNEVYNSTGIAFSPSNRFLYVNFSTSVDGQNTFQYDLDSTDIQSSLDTIIHCTTGLYACGTIDIARALNNKLYIGAVIDTNSYHVIHKPNKKGQACDFDYGGLELPAKLPNSPMAYYPNYRLGPIDGSPCDTLGINNLPVAAFLWDSVQLQASFTNNSYYEPTDFLWDFGDGSSSAETDPVHYYAEPGIYHVCLTASNAFGSDSTCQWVTVDSLIDTTSSVLVLPEGNRSVSVVPNPTTGQVRVVLETGLPIAATWILQDALGRVVAHAVLSAGQREVEVGLPSLANGLYFWKVRSEAGLLGSGKLILQP